MRVEVYDDNLFLKKFMGYANVILEECFTNPGFSKLIVKI
jgi:hypothetical protein